MEYPLLLQCINVSTPTTFSSTARSNPLGASCSRFLLSEDDKLMTEQFELGALLESTLPRLYLVIHFSEFLQEKRSARKINIMKINKWGRGNRSRSLTMTRDFFTPKTASLERKTSPSGYSDVTSLWKPGASIIM